MKTRIIQHTGKGGNIRINSETFNDRESAAKKAAQILARREYGKRGCVGAFRLDSIAADNSASTYQAFIGAAPARADMRRGNNGITGHNVWIYA